jgi:predicted Zn-dependent protease
LQNVEQPNPYKKDTVAAAFFSIEAVAAILCMGFFWMSIPRYDTDPSEKAMDAVNGATIIEEAMALKPGQLVAQGKLDEAVKEAETLIGKSKHKALANICAGNVFCQANLYDDGLKYLKNAVALSHRNRYVIENYAEKLAEAGKTDDAIAQFESLANADKNWVAPHQQLAKLYFDTERPAEAADQLKFVLSLNEHNFNARKQRGIALALSNNMKEGLDEYVRGEQDESRTGIPTAIKSVLGNAGPKAIDRVTYELQQQINNHPDDYLPKLRLAQLYQYSNDLQNAKDNLLDARRLKPQNAEIQRTLAIVQKQLGEDTQAMNAFALSVKLDQQAQKDKNKSSQ